MRKVQDPAKVAFHALMIVVVVVAFLLRLPALDARPMHCDEAVHAYKLGILVETGEYEYNPREYHGPVLYYATLPFVWLSGADSYTELTETMLRIVPVLFGIGIILLLWTFRDALGSKECLLAGLLMALSPAMVFYSRYYIQEMLLVFFSFAAIALGWRYYHSGKGWFAALAGVSAGLMYATKETCVLAWTSMVLAILLTKYFNRRIKDVELPHRPAMKRKHFVMAAVIAVSVAFLFLTGLLTHPQGAVDCLKSYVHYIERSGLAGPVPGGESVAIDAAQHHYHPWYFYLKMLLFSRYGPGPWWSEGLIVLLAVLGGIRAFRKGKLPGRDISLYRFLTLYTLILIVVYSAIPYKTPWVMLGFLLGMILLAGAGFVGLVEYFSNRVVKFGLWILFAFGVWHLGHQARLATGLFESDPRNPYVYAHTSRDLLRLVDRIEGLDGVLPDGITMHINVITNDYWPLPWYLRDYSQVGYWNTIPENPQALVVVTKPEFEEQMEKQLGPEYRKEYFGLRPEVLMTAYIQDDIWEHFIRSQEATR